MNATILISIIDKNFVKLLEEHSFGKVSGSQPEILLKKLTPLQISFN